MQHPARFVVCTLLGVLTLGFARASEPASGAQPPVLSVALQEIYEKPEGPGGSKFQPVIVTADTVQNLGELKVFDVVPGLKSRAQARDEQLAWFLYLSKVEATPDTLTVAYEKPYNGKFGTVVLKRVDGAWTVADHSKMHSSSGARYFYGELYEGVECRDGSEMAKRWNFYNDAIQAMTARRARTPEAELSTTCPGETFPDVLAYEQAKKMGLFK